MTDTLTLDQLFDMEMAQLKQEHGREPDPDSWRWSPSDIRIWDNMLAIANRYLDSIGQTNQISIWEAGSGIGTKLYWAKHHYGMIEYGFEKFNYYIEAARRLDVQCELRDLSDLNDQPAWNVPDIVFTARPFKDEMLEHKWEAIVQNDMRPGAVLIATYAAVKPRNWAVLYRAPFRGVWVKPNNLPDTPERIQATISIR